MGRTVVRQVRSLEKEPGRTLIWRLSSEFGVRKGPNPGSAGLEFEERIFLNLLCFSSEFREKIQSFSKLRHCQTRVWLGPFFELRTCKTKVWPCPFYELQTLAGSEFGERNWPFSNSEPAEPGLGLVLSPNSESARVRSWEKGTGLSPNSKPAEPGFGAVLPPNYEPARVWSSE